MMKVRDDGEEMKGTNARFNMLLKEDLIRIIDLGFGDFS